MNATSIAPPMPTMKGGRPLANVVTCPVFGSTRDTLPAAPSVTNNAPPGPTVLPDPPARPLTNNVAVGAASRWPRVPNGVSVAMRTAAPKKVSVLVEIMVRLLREHGCCEGLEGYRRDVPVVNRG